MLILLVVLASAAVCPDRLMHDTGVGGSEVAYLTNTSTYEECCDLCHGNYHDVCFGWTWGESRDNPPWNGLDNTFPPHNCAIMNKRYDGRHVAGHISGYPSSPPPPPVSGPPCNADINCDIRRDKQWRCQHSKVPRAPNNSCHLPGPGSAGNSTCACASPRCAAGPKAPKNASQTQYLMIGDSISLGMEHEVQSVVSKHNWEVTHNPGNAASSNLGWHCLENWLQASARKYDIVSYNFGLHDLGFDTERISVEQYGALLGNITGRLVELQRQQGFKIAWISTSPVPTVPTYGPACNETSHCLNPPRFDDDVVLFNARAAALVAEHVAAGAAITTIDLYSFVLKRCGGKGYKTCPGFQLPMNVHFTPEGWAAIGQFVSAALLAA